MASHRDKDEALTAMSAMFGPRWSHDQLADVLCFYDDNADRAVEALLTHASSELSPDDVIRRFFRRHRSDQQERRQTQDQEHDQHFMVPPGGCVSRESSLAGTFICGERVVGVLTSPFASYPKINVDSYDDNNDSHHHDRQQESYYYEDPRQIRQLQQRTTGLLSPEQEELLERLLRAERNRRNVSFSSPHSVGGFTSIDPTAIENLTRAVPDTTANNASVSLYFKESSSDSALSAYQRTSSPTTPPHCPHDASPSPGRASPSSANTATARTPRRVSPPPSPPPPSYTSAISTPIMTTTPTAAAAAPTTTTLIREGEHYSSACSSVSSRGDDSTNSSLSLVARQMTSMGLRCNVDHQRVADAYTPASAAGNASSSPLRGDPFSPSIIPPAAAASAVTVAASPRHDDSLYNSNCNRNLAINSGLPYSNEYANRNGLYSSSPEEEGRNVFVGSSGQTNENLPDCYEHSRDVLAPRQENNASNKSYPTPARPFSYLTVDEKDSLLHALLQNETNPSRPLPLTERSLSTSVISSAYTNNSSTPPPERCYGPPPLQRGYTTGAVRTSREDDAVNEMLRREEEDEFNRAIEASLAESHWRNQLRSAAGEPENLRERNLEIAIEQSLHEVGRKSARDTGLVGNESDRVAHKSSHREREDGEDMTSACRANTKGDYSHQSNSGRACVEDWNDFNNCPQTRSSNHVDKNDDYEENEESSCLDAHDFNDGVVTVKGAGVEGVNGTYERTGSCGGVGKYMKQGVWKGRMVNFTVYRCWLSGSERRWFISIVPDGSQPGTDQDKDFYCAPGTSDFSLIDEETPPEAGWTVIKPLGVNPSPNCLFEMLLPLAEGQEDVVILENAGSEMVNGAYMKNGYSDGVPMYTKEALWNGSRVTFAVFRTISSGAARIWFISVIPSGCTPGSNADMDLYTAESSTEGGDETIEEPPRRGWNVIAGFGIDPPPLCRVQRKSIFLIDDPQFEPLEPAQRLAHRPRKGTQGDMKRPSVPLSAANRKEEEESISGEESNVSNDIEKMRRSLSTSVNSERMATKNNKLSRNLSEGANRDVHRRPTRQDWFLVTDEKDETRIRRVAMCVVCRANTVTHVFVPCGHPCLCDTCASTSEYVSSNRTCPIGRCQIQSVMKFYGTLVEEKS